MNTDPQSAMHSETLPLTEGIVFDVKRYALHDGPGIRTTVFFKGCPLRCRWCHNPESLRQGPEHLFRAARCIGCDRCLKVCPEGGVPLDDRLRVELLVQCRFCGNCVEACGPEARVIVGRRVTVPQLMGEILRDRPFFEQSGGGVTFSGGEPLMQHEFLLQMLRQCRREMLHTAIDTTCHASWSVLEPIAEAADLLLCDVKHCDSQEHQKLTGVSNRLIFENLDRLNRLGRPIILRMPIVPGLNDGPENIEATGRLAARLGSVRRLDLLPYHPGGSSKASRLVGNSDRPDIVPPSPERMKELAARLAEFGISVTIGG